MVVYIYIMRAPAFICWLYIISANLPVFLALTDESIFPARDSCATQPGTLADPHPPPCPQAEAHNLCGTVTFESASPAKRPISIKPASGGTATTVTTGSDGSFCSMLAPGEYVVTPGAISGVIVAPNFVKVSNKEGPVSSVRFGQAALDIKGMVRLRIWGL